MQGNQLRKNTARTVNHNDINNYPYLNIPMMVLLQSLKKA
ncbi:hypothetical protein IIM_05039 [Bacillus cereus VD107]|nr:hypothetical protein IIM_05039 [Bacillus cereus VD107]